MQHIMQLPVVLWRNPVKVREFYEKLVTCVQALETMVTLQEINSTVFFLIDKIPGIRAELVRNNDNWEEWNFQRFVENPQKVDWQKSPGIKHISF